MPNLINVSFSQQEEHLKKSGLSQVFSPDQIQALTYYITSISQEKNQQLQDQWIHQITINDQFEQAKKNLEQKSASLELSVAKMNEITEQFLKISTSVKNSISDISNKYDFLIQQEAEKLASLGQRIAKAEKENHESTLKVDDLAENGLLDRQKLDQVSSNLTLQLNEKDVEIQKLQWGLDSLKETVNTNYAVFLEELADNQKLAARSGGNQISPDQLDLEISKILETKSNQQTQNFAKKSEVNKIKKALVEFGRIKDNHNNKYNLKFKNFNQKIESNQLQVQATSEDLKFTEMLVQNNSILLDDLNRKITAFETNFSQFLEVNTESGLVSTSDP